MANETDKQVDTKTDPRTGAAGQDPAGKSAEPAKAVPPADREWDPWSGVWVPKRLKR